MSDPLEPIENQAADERPDDSDVAGFDPDIDPVRSGDEAADGD
jgi:hypothetical protein